MDVWDQRPPAFEKTLAPATGHPCQPSGERNDRRLNICVIFTSAESTLEALQRAGALAMDLGARITLFALQPVPFPLPLDSPPVLLDWSETRFRDIARVSPVETTVRVYLCRDILETLKGALSPGSLVVVGGRKTWWPLAAEKRLARELRRAGHEVIFAERE